MLKKIDQYIIKNFLSTFVFLLICFSAIAIVIDLTEKLGDFIDRKVPISQILLYFTNFLPFILALLFPIFIFVAVIFFTSKIANKSEIIAILSNGMTFRRMLRPYLISASIICVILLFANHYIIPKTNKKKIEFEEQYLWNHKYSKDDNFHIRISPNEYIFMSSWNPESKTGFRFSYEKIEGTLIKEKILAERCEYDTIKNQWKLTEAYTRYNTNFGEKLIYQKSTLRKLKCTPNDLIERREAKQRMTTPQLNAYINKQTEKGSENLNEFYIEKYRRTAAPFSAFILSIMGACIASRKVRGGSGLHLAIGLMISAIYIFMMQFSTTFAIKGSLSPLLAVWIPNILFSILAFFIYKKYSK